MCVYISLTELEKNKTLPLYCFGDHNCNQVIRTMFRSCGRRNWLSQLGLSCSLINPIKLDLFRCVPYYIHLMIKTTC